MACILEDEVYCKTRVKFIYPTNKLDFKDSTCTLTISVGQPSHEGDRLLATILKINETFQQCNIMVCDTLQRFNSWQFLSPSASKKDMYDYSKSEGDKWLIRNRKILNQLTIPVKITRWDYWLNHPLFPQINQKMRDTLLQDNDYLAVLNYTVNEYKERLLNRNTIENSNINSVERTILGSKAYLIEESVIMLLMNKITNYKYELYPGKRNNVLAYIHEHYIKKQTQQNLNHVSIKFLTRKHLNI